MAVQADLSLSWSHRSYCRFSCALAEMLMICAHREDTTQSGHPYDVFRVTAARLKKQCISLRKHVYIMLTPLNPNSI